MANKKFFPQFLPYNKNLKERARTMRNNPTDTEKKMWNLLRSGDLAEYRFLRQKIIGNYIADFYCSKQQLIIEIDGGGHNENNQKEYDTIRTKFFESLGTQVIRFWNTDVLQNETGVYQKVLEIIEKHHA